MFNGAGSLDLVVVQANDPLFGAYVGAAQHSEQDSPLIIWWAQYRFPESSMLRPYPLRLELPLGKTGFKQCQVHIGTGLALGGNVQFATVCIVTDNRRLNLVLVGKLHEP
jgi:hypothetical protein